MTPRWISVEELRAKVRFEDLVEPVSAAFQASSAGAAQNGLVVMFPGETPSAGDVYVKTGALRGHRVFIVKISPWFKSNVDNGEPQGGFVGVFDARNGHTLAILDDQHYLSDIRTAAAGALAARAFAPATITTAAVLGSGVQAYWQALALHRERPYRSLLVWARDARKADDLVRRLGQTLPSVSIHASADLPHTVNAADVLITATLSKEPLVRTEWLRAGQHITAVGADDPTKCELEPSVLRRSRVFVDSIETSVANGDVYRAIRSGQYQAQEIQGEIGDVLAGRKTGRTSPSDITIVKLVGIGAQDLVAAETALGCL